MTNSQQKRVERFGSEHFYHFSTGEKQMFRTINTLAIATSLSLVLIMPHSVSASLINTEAAISFPVSPATGYGAAGWCDGWLFTLDDPKSLTHLGIYNYNHNQESLAGTYDRRIGLWDASGLVADVTIPVDGGEYDPVDGGFVYAEITPNITLQANEEYAIGAYYDGDNGPGSAHDVNFTTISGVNYVSAAGRFGWGKPTSTTVSPNYANGFFGPNLRFVVPEPSTGLLSLLGLTGCILARRRRRSARG